MSCDFEATDWCARIGAARWLPRGEDTVARCLQYMIRGGKADAHRTRCTHSKRLARNKRVDNLAQSDFAPFAIHRPTLERSRRETHQAGRPVDATPDNAPITGPVDRPVQPDRRRFQRKGRTKPEE